MIESQNPFTARPKPPPAAKWRRHIPVALVTLVTLVALVAGFLGWAGFRQQAQKLERAKVEAAAASAATARSQTEAANLKTKLTGSDAHVAELKTKLAAGEARVAELEKEKELVGQMHRGLEQEMRAALESKDVTISQLQGKLTVNILDRILFDSGEAVLQPGGEAVLQKIAGILAQHPDLKIHVIGHTDDVPIRVSARSKFASNWELSMARALAAVRFLTETAGVDPRRLGAVGYGEFRPLASNATPEGRAKNRRIAITILADELVGADTVPPSTTNSPALLPAVSPVPTNSPPDGK